MCGGWGEGHLFICSLASSLILRMSKIIHDLPEVAQSVNKRRFCLSSMPVMFRVGVRVRIRVRFRVRVRVRVKVRVRVRLGSGLGLGYHSYLTFPWLYYESV